MAKLGDLLSTRQLYGNEQNLIKGKVWTVAPTSMYTCIRSDNGFCWHSPGRGMLTIELWGAAGSGSRMCCCGFGLPGNAPGYSRKKICVDCGTWICGCPGQACNGHGLCNSGCSLPTYMCWGCARDMCGNWNACMCAEGGRSGTAFCSTTPSAYCCFATGGFCHTRLNGDNCAIVCNHCDGGFLACGYGGDVNCCGCIGCMSFMGCYPSCPCQTYIHYPVAAMIFSECGGHATVNGESEPEYTMWSGTGQHQMYYGLAAMSNNPTTGIPWTPCYNSSQGCGCYETFGCYPYTPYGVGGRPPFPCPGIRDHGGRGGHGMIRLTYVGENYHGTSCAKLGNEIS